MQITGKPNYPKFWAEKVPGKIIVVLFSGGAGVGKTTYANMMAEYLQSKGFKTITKSFADGVKDCAIEYFNWNGEKDERGRKLLQMIGTEVGRTYNVNIWVDYLVDKILEYSEREGPPDVVIIDDFRFPNEYEVIADTPYLYPISIRIVAPTREVLSGTEEGEHYSERALDNFDKFDIGLFVDTATLDECEAHIHGIVDDFILHNYKED